MNWKLGIAIVAALSGCGASKQALAVENAAGVLIANYYKAAGRQCLRQDTREGYTSCMVVPNLVSSSFLAASYALESGDGTACETAADGLAAAAIAASAYPYGAGDKVVTALNGLASVLSVHCAR